MNDATRNRGAQLAGSPGDEGREGLLAGIQRHGATALSTPDGHEASARWRRRWHSRRSCVEFERNRLALFARRWLRGRGAAGSPTREGEKHVHDRPWQGHRPTALIDGGLSQAGEWYPLAGRIPGYVIIPDRPGCGVSYPIDYRRVDFRQAAADWMLDLADGIGADQVNLVGNSMGGFFALAFASDSSTPSASPALWARRWASR